MPSFLKYLGLLALAANGIFAAPQGNSPCAHWCQDNWQTCPEFKNRGACVSYAAHNDFICGCPAPPPPSPTPTPPPPPPAPKCPEGEVWVEAKGCCVSTSGW